MIWNDKLRCYLISELNQIDVNELANKEIELLIIDIRGTIINHHKIDSYFLKLMEQINDTNCFKVLFATNNCSYYTNKIRHELITINFLASYLYFACKPLLFRIKHKIKHMQLGLLLNASLPKIAIIGNQLNTDGALANKLHALLIYFQK